MSSLEGFRRGNDRDAARRAGKSEIPAPPERSGDDADDVDIDALIQSRRSAPTQPAPAASPSPAKTTRPAADRPVPATKTATPAAVSRKPTSPAPARPAPTGPSPKTVRSMNVPPELMVGLRVLAAVRNSDHPELVMTAVAEHADSIPPAVETVKRRRRLQTAKLLVKLTDEQTGLIDQLAEERLMTRSSFITAVLEEFVPAEMRGRS